MKKWMKNLGIVSAIAAVSVMSFAAVSFAQAETQTPSAVPGIVERVQNGVRGEFGGPGGERGGRGGEVDGAKDATLAEALGLTVEELQDGQGCRSDAWKRSPPPRVWTWMP